MDITVVTPAAKGSRSGNRTTAARWAAILRRLGHQVRLALAYEGEQTDLLIALHAWRSAASVLRFRERHPQKPIVVGLGGTDIYRYLASDPETVLGSLDLADALVGLHDLVGAALPEHVRHKLTVIYQSAQPLVRCEKRRRSFDVLVAAHLREEKDPLRTAAAARLLPAASRVRVIHFGRAYDARWTKRARAEMVENTRYRWVGEVPHWQVRRALAEAPVMVLSSVMEGGANVISEAVMAGVPVLASRIAGSVGLLGSDYTGYFAIGDTAALSQLIWRAEQESDFLAELGGYCAARTPLFHPARERAAWQALLEGLSDEGDRLERQAARQNPANDRGSGVAERVQSGDALLRPVGRSAGQQTA
jgi:putative glycosyltransferase (TIGR04348 family)